jgi:hypothetical protein
MALVMRRTQADVCVLAEMRCAEISIAADVGMIGGDLDSESASVEACVRDEVNR